MEEKKKSGSAKKVILVILISIVIVLALLIVVPVGVVFFSGMELLNSLDRSTITGNINLSEDEVYEGATVDATDSVEHIEQAQSEFEQAQQIDPLEAANIDNILLIGSDRRNTNEYGRSDSMILVTVNHDTNKIHLTSLMRAMYVCIPRSDGNVWGMLNAAYSWGGPQLLIDTIELNFRIDVDRYVVVDFTAFERAIDLLGGVEITLSDAEAAHVKSNSGIPTPSGTQLLNGAQARGYCQIRYIDNDFVRTDRQRTVLTKLIKKGLTTDIGTLINIMEQILPLVNTNLTNGEILAYMFEIPVFLANPITDRMLPIENESGKTYTGIIFVGGREMYKVDFETNIRALHNFMLS